MPNAAKLLTDTLRLADGGRVECDVMTPDGSVAHGVIEHSFFEDFMGVPNPKLTPEKQSRIVQENMAYLEAEADRQWRMGLREVVIR